MVGHPKDQSIRAKKLNERVLGKTIIIFDRRDGTTIDQGCVVKTRFVYSHHEPCEIIEIESIISGQPRSTRFRPTDIYGYRIVENQCPIKNLADDM